MVKYRGRLEIIAAVLRVIGEGAKKTHVMYGANLSYRLVSRYLNWVVRAGLVRTVRGSGSLYKVTAKGQRFLERYEEFSEHREKLRERMDRIEGERAELENMCSLE